MSYNADRMRELISDTAAVDQHVMDVVLEMADALDHYTEAVNRMATAAERRFQDDARLIGELRDDLHAVVYRVERLGDAFALRSELDDLRAEVIERTATPFDPREDDHAA